MRRILVPCLVCALAALPSSMTEALDLTKGVMQALPTPGGKAPGIDGDLKDWDLSAEEPVWIAAQTAAKLHAQMALMYDDQYLYVGGEMSLPGRPYHNASNPTDAFWWSDLVQFRFVADPAIPAPLDPNDAATKASDRIAHISFWKNSDTGKDYLHIAYGIGLDKGSAVNPEGSQVVITPHGTSSYTLEARIPWSALHVPGGKNPFKAGQSATAVYDLHWGGETATAALYRTNPGAFAFMQPQTWGQAQFSATGKLTARHETMEQILARLTAPAQTAAAVGVPITVNVPNASRVSVNILGPHGEVLRELIGGEEHPKGPLTLHWDGKDQWGTPMTPGSYRWGAYFSGGLKAKFMGGVGKSADPYWDSLDGKGSWGGDHSDPISVAADEHSLYFLWPVAEGGRALVKTDYQGKVIWRKTPFVGGGFGPFYGVASNGKYVFLTFGDNKPQLVRLNAENGQTTVWGDKPDSQPVTPISDTAAVKVPGDSSPLGVSNVAFGASVVGQPEASGLACSVAEVFSSVYSQDKIQVLDAETGAITRTLSCPGPRGLCLDKSGNLFAVSYVSGKSAQVVKFAAAQGSAVPAVTEGLVAPWGVAVDAQGAIHVSDEGKSQQVKTFSADGKFVNALGKAGGRAYAGTYDPDAFLHPAGIAVDAKGGLLVAESSIPKVMSRWDIATGKPLGRWFGAPQYWNGTWPDSTDPTKVYYELTNGFARAALSRPDYPEAYWSLPSAGYPEAGVVGSGLGIPEIVDAANGRKYLADDADLHAIYLVQGDQMLPVAHLHFLRAKSEENKTDHGYLEVWQDRNGDHHMQVDEVARLDTVDGKPLAEVVEQTGSMHMQPNGDLYLMTGSNKILKVPAKGFEKDGSLRWNLAAASYAVPAIVPSLGDSMYAGWRGQAGLRVDGQGNIYTCFAANVPIVTPELSKQMRERYPALAQWEWGAYATRELADKYHEGLGHTGESNAVKFAKFDKQGRLLWMAGRKATAAAGPGEMYHFWALAGLIGDDYIAGASEWGPISIYTKDGFFVDTLMNNPGLAPPPGPYTFGSETNSGRVQYFPKRDEVWAYAVGMAYTVEGFKKGKVIGEQRKYGSIKLDKVYEAAEDAQTARSLQIAAVTGDPLSDTGGWSRVPSSAISRNGEEFASAQIGYDDSFLYSRIHVADDSPLQNSADAVNTAFKGGDTAGIVLGSSPQHDQPQAGDIRLMAAQINGQPHLIAMKMVTAQGKHPEDYYTPAGGHARFEFVGDVPGGKVTLTRDADGKGYTALFAVPRSFLEFDLKAGTFLVGDVEVRLSGAGPRGLQATSRNYLFTPLRSETTMTDDLPTESRLYPQYWSAVAVK